MSWFGVKQAIQSRDPARVVEALKGECDPKRTLELALREMGQGPVCSDHKTIGYCGLYHVWHYCVPCGESFSHSQGAWNHHRACNGVINIPVYPSKRQSVVPEGASWRYREEAEVQVRRD